MPENQRKGDPEFRETAVPVVRETGKTIRQMADDSVSTTRRSLTGDGWRPARPRDETERVTGRVCEDVLAVEPLCAEGQYARLG